MPQWHASRLRRAGANAHPLLRPCAGQLLCRHSSSKRRILVPNATSLQAASPGPSEEEACSASV
eukprot:scaffold518_cov388-Prasinococcus_capsulatus_cf.AAC.6